MLDFIISNNLVYNLNVAFGLKSCGRKTYSASVSESSEGLKTTREVSFVAQQLPA